MEELGPEYGVQDSQACLYTLKYRELLQQKDSFIATLLIIHTENTMG